MEPLNRAVVVVAVVVLLSIVSIGALGSVSAQEPTIEPTVEPTIEPTVEPTIEPTMEPTIEPTMEPTVEPTVEPTIEPTVEPTVEPTMEPTVEPTVEPTMVPTIEPTGEPSVSPTAEPSIEATDPTGQLSSIVIYKLLCTAIDEQAENSCVGRVEAAEDTTVLFVVTEVGSGYAQTFGVSIEAFDGVTIGALLVDDVTPGIYQISEMVPTGYEGLAVPLTEDQIAEGAEITTVVGPVEEAVLFVNVPLEPGPPVITPPKVKRPAVTPTVGASLQTLTTVPSAPTAAETDVTILPDAGSGPTVRGSDVVLALELGAAALLLIIGLLMRRRASH
jgi:hypothetical protein